MAILENFSKQSAETQDYDIDFTEYLYPFSDKPLSFTATADVGITLAVYSITGNVVKVWLSGGTDQTDYKVTVILTTTGGRVKQADIVIRIHNSRNA